MFGKTQHAGWVEQCMRRMASLSEARSGIPAHLSVKQEVGSSPPVQMGPQASSVSSARAFRHV